MQKLTLFFVAIAATMMFALWQRNFVGAFEAQFDERPTLASQNDGTVLSQAVAAVLEPDFFDKPASHSALTMSLVQSDPANQDLDQAGQIRAAFALGDDLGHDGVMKRYLSTAKFANGCEGLEEARTGLQIAADVPAAIQDLALAAMLENSGSTQKNATQLRNSVVDLAKNLSSENRIPTEIMVEIEALSASTFAISGGCSS